MYQCKGPWSTHFDPLTYDVIEDETVVDMAVSVYGYIHCATVLHRVFLWHRTKDVRLHVWSSRKFRLLVIDVQQLNKYGDWVIQNTDDTTVIGNYSDLQKGENMI